MKRNSKIGIKLAGIVEDALKEKHPEIDRVLIDEEDIHLQKGAYTHATWDLARWWVDANAILKNGHTVSTNVHSWDKASVCAKRGIELQADDMAYRYEANAL